MGVSDDLDGIFRPIDGLVNFCGIHILWCYGIWCPTYAPKGTRNEPSLPGTRLSGVAHLVFNVLSGLGCHYHLWQSPALTDGVGTHSCRYPHLFLLCA